VLGDLAKTFEEDLRGELGATDLADRFHETIDSAMNWRVDRDSRRTLVAVPHRLMRYSGPDEGDPSAPRVMLHTHTHHLVPQERTVS
jgi:hypothetical protein